MKSENYFLNLKFNKLLWDEQIPYHDLVPAIKEHFYPECQNRIKKIELLSPDEGLIFQLESVFWEIDQCMSMVSAMNHIDRSLELSGIMEEAESLKLELRNALFQNENIFQKLTILEKNTKSKRIKNLTQNWILSFNTSGFGLSKRKFKRLSEIDKDLSSLEINFQNEIQTNMNSAYLVHPVDSVNGLPSHLLNSSKIENGNYIFKAENATQIITLAEDGLLREKAWKLDRKLGKETHINELIIQISALRQEKAKLFGFKSYTDFSLNQKLIENKKKLDTFLKPILLNSQSLFKKREKEIKKHAKSINHSKIKPWDTDYLNHKLLIKNNLDEQYITTFFPLDNALSGTIKFLENEWKISLKENLVSDKGTLYDVSYKDQYLGQIFMDLFFRESKLGGEWAVNYTQGGFNVNPIVILGCALNKNERCISIPNLKIFFHELGHCLHFLLNRTYDPSICGYDGVQEDFSEFPSQLMEYFVLDDIVLPYISLFTDKDKDFIKKIQTHYQNEEDNSLISEFYWLYLDFAYHNRKVSSVKSLQSLELQVHRKVFQKDPNFSEFHRINAFEHTFLESYAASYFMYLWSRILSKEAYNKSSKSKNWESLILHGFMTKGENELAEFKLI